MNGQKVIKVFCHEEESIESFDKLNDELFHTSERANRYANILGPILNNIGNVLYVLVALAGGGLLLAAAPNVSISGMALSISIVVPPLALERLDAIQPDSPTELFFVTRTGKAWTQREVRDALTRLGRRHGLRLHPHLLRHSAASISLARGANIEAVRDMLGHASLSTTQRYVRAAATLDGSPAYSLAAAIAVRGSEQQPNDTP